VPGTKVMSARQNLIHYSIDTLPRGAELRIVTGDSAAVEAIHSFLAFQRHDHRTGAIQ
jgi:TusA-related sulfurtransferase